MKAKKITEKLGKGILFLIGGLVVLIATFLLVILLNSSGTAEPMVNKNGDSIPNSIAVIKDTVINGAAQRLTIRGEDKSNPVLLRIHGGPGQPHAPQTFKFMNMDLEDVFTVCYWDQRGSGPAYTEDLPDSTITLEQIVKDGIEVTNYLIDRFGKEKIYLEGISWGTVVGAFMAQRQPDLFEAFIGIGQVSNKPRNEKLSYNFVLEEARNRNDTTAIRELKRIGPPPYKTIEEIKVAVPLQRSYVSKYVPSKITMSTYESLRLMLLYKGWSLGYKMKVLTEGMYGVSTPILWSENVNLNLIKAVPEWEIPIYILQGENDHFAETTLAKAYFDSLEAPSKEFYLFDDSGHFVSAENPEKYRSIVLNDILQVDSHAPNH